MDANNSHLLELLCQEFPLTRTEAWEIIRSAPKRYKVHFIEKRNGRGQRLIAQPTAELKIIQRWIIKRFISLLPVHKAATAYRQNINIADHARIHASNKYLLKIDFRDFFPSIQSSDFILHAVKHLKISTTLAAELAQLLFRLDEKKRLVLSIGAPSSPSLSNTMMYDFDCRLAAFCEINEITYSRYADDLALSTNRSHELDEVAAFVIQLLRSIVYPKLEINPEKTVFTSKKYQRQLTGLILSNDGKVSLGRDRKRLIRATANRYKNGTLDPESIAKLKGWLAFALSVEPEYVRNIRKMITEENYRKLISTGISNATE
jgi:RNA-directed DNA polymerase